MALLVLPVVALLVLPVVALLLLLGLLPLLPWVTERTTLFPLGPVKAMFRAPCLACPILLIPEWTIPLDPTTVTIRLLLDIMSVFISVLWFLISRMVPMFRLPCFRRWHLLTVACPVKFLPAIMNRLPLELLGIILTVSRSLLPWNPTFRMLVARWFTGCSRLLLVRNPRSTLSPEIRTTLLLVPYSVVLTSLLVPLLPLLVTSCMVTRLFRCGELHLVSGAPPIPLDWAVSIRHSVILQPGTDSMARTALLGVNRSRPVMRRFPELCEFLGSLQVPTWHMCFPPAKNSS